MRRLTIIQVLPALDAGGVERGTLEIGRSLVAAGHRSIVVSGGGRLEAQLVTEGSEHVTMDIGRKSLLTFLRCVKPLRNLARETRADVIHVRSRMPAWVAWFAWRGMPEASRPHFMTTFHGTYTPGIYSSVMTKGERVIAISEMIRGYITRHYPKVNPANIRLIHRGVDPAAFPRNHRPSDAWFADFFAKYPAARGKALITLPARITRWKGQEDFLRVIAQLRRDGHAVHGLLLGDVHPRRQSFMDELVSLAAALGIADDVSFLGHRSDVKEIMAASQIVYSLSKDPEAFGRISLEALSLGVPVIAYDHGGVAEQMRVLLPSGAVPVGDIAAVVARTSEFLRQKPTIPPDHPFTLQRMQAATLAIYAELTGSV